MPPAWAGLETLGDLAGESEHLVQLDGARRSRARRVFPSTTSIAM